MLRNLLVLALLMLGVTGYGRDRAQAPDLATIKEAVSDQSSPLYYPLLLQRFADGDTSMNLSEKRHLYYGYPSASRYSPYASSGFEDSIRSVLAHGTLIESDYVRLLAFTDSALHEQTFDLRSLSYRAFAAKKSGNTEIASLTLNKINLLLDAILSSGDGKSARGAFWVLDVSHEYFLLAALGLEYGGNQRLVDGPCDYLTVKNNDHGVEGVYFNVSISFNAMAVMFEDDDIEETKSGK